MLKSKFFLFMTTRIGLTIILYSAFAIHAQSINDSLQKYLPAQNFQDNKNQPLSDTIKKLPIQQLKLINNYMLNELNKLNEKRILSDWFKESSTFTKEELESGLSETEILAFKKNKQVMQNILNMSYEESWWFRVKSLGQLIGIPDIYIKMLEFALLMLL